MMLVKDKVHFKNEFVILILSPVNIRCCARAIADVVNACFYESYCT